MPLLPMWSADHICAADVPLQIGICDLLWRLSMTSVSKIKKKHDFVSKILAHGAPEDNQLVDTVPLFLEIRKGAEYETVQLCCSMRT